MCLDELRRAIFVLLFWLCVFSIKTGTRRIIRVDELCSVVRLERRKTDDCLCRRINASVCIKTAHRRIIQ